MGGRDDGASMTDSDDDDEDYDEIDDRTRRQSLSIGPKGKSPYSPVKALEVTEELGRSPIYELERDEVAITDDDGDNGHDAYNPSRAVEMEILISHRTRFDESYYSR